MNPFSLAGRNALIIGGTSGIGKAIAAGFAGAGAQVIVAGRDTAKLERAVTDLSAVGKAHGHACDVRDPASLRGLVELTIANHQHIDILVNSQGVIRLKPAEEFTLEDWD